MRLDKFGHICFTNILEILEYYGIAPVVFVTTIWLAALRFIIFGC